jgi:hypothetical protein
MLSRLAPVLLLKIADFCSYILSTHKGDCNNSLLDKPIEMWQKPLERFLEKIKNKK